MSDQSSLRARASQTGPSTNRCPVEMRWAAASSGISACATAVSRSTGAATSLATAALVTEQVPEDVRRPRGDELDDRGLPAVDGAQRALERGLDGGGILDALGRRAERLRNVRQAPVAAPAHLPQRRIEAAAALHRRQLRERVRAVVQQDDEDR